MIISQYRTIGIKITLVDVGSTLKVCSVSLLDRLNIHKSTIRHDSLSIMGFDNVAKKSLGVIIIPLTIGVVTLNTPIHIMSYQLSRNLILGREWIHAMNSVPSTLHRKIKYIYNNKVHTLDIDPKPYTVLHLEKTKENPLNTLTPTTQVEPTQKNDKHIEHHTTLLDDDWGSLYFEHYFTGKYKIIQKDSNKGKDT